MGLKRSSWYLDYLFIVVGTVFMAVAINSIFDPVGMVTGGFSGISIIIKEFFDIPLWITNIVLNIPLFLLGIPIMGMKFMKKSILGAVMLTLWLAVIPSIDIVRQDLILASLFGGVFMGIGVGIVFLGNGTTGGTDTVAALIQHYLPHYSIAQIMQIIDGIIILIGAYVFGLYTAMYAMISIFIVAKVTDGFLEGLKFSKVAYIITDEYDTVSEKIMENLNRGVTAIPARGMYSRNEKVMLFSVVSKKEIVPLKRLVAEVDPAAFVIVSDAREVLGEGFIEEILRKC